MYLLKMQSTLSLLGHCINEITYCFKVDPFKAFQVYQVHEQYSIL